MFKDGSYYGAKLTGRNHCVLEATMPIIELVVKCPLVRSFDIRCINGRNYSQLPDYRIQKVKSGIRIYVREQDGGQFITVHTQDEAGFLDFMHKALRTRKMNVVHRPEREPRPQTNRDDSTLRRLSAWKQLP